MQSHKFKGSAPVAPCVGPGEALAMLLAILGVRLMFGLDYLYETYVTAMRKVSISWIASPGLQNSEPDLVY